MPEITAYCMKCKAKRTIKDPKPITHPNGREAVTGVCSKCGTKIFRMGKMPGGKAAAEVVPAPTATASKKKRSRVTVS